MGLNYWQYIQGSDEIVSLGVELPQRNQQPHVHELEVRGHGLVWPGGMGAAKSTYQIHATYKWIPTKTCGEVWSSAWLHSGTTATTSHETTTTNDDDHHLKSLSDSLPE